MTAESAPVFRSMVQLKAWLAERHARTVVLADGCFDPLHVGHVRYLYGAKEHGDCLIVAVNDDNSTRALKGADRPIGRVAGRARVVAALEMVDAVLIFSARDVRRVLKSLRPQVHANGTDYTPDTVPEADMSASLGVKTVIVGDAKTHASRDIVDRLAGCASAGETTG